MATRQALPGDCPQRPRRKPHCASTIAGQPRRRGRPKARRVPRSSTLWKRGCRCAPRARLPPLPPPKSTHHPTQKPRPNPTPSRPLRRRCPSPSTHAPAAHAAAAAHVAASVQVASRLQPRPRATRRALERTAQARRHPSGRGVARVPACATRAAAAGAAPMAAAAAAARPWRRRAPGSSRAHRALRGVCARGRPRPCNDQPPLWASASWAGR